MKKVDRPEPSKSLLFGIIFSLLILSSCASISQQTINDPYEKLKIAGEIMSGKARPLAAEMLISEAITDFSGRNDETGLAEAYRYYGFFMQSEAVTAHGDYFKEHGFLDQDARFDQRLDRAIFYFKQARDLYEKNHDLARLSNLYVNIGYAYSLNNNLDATCVAFDLSVLTYNRNLKLSPETRLVLPKGFKTYADYMNAEKGRFKCP